MAAPTPSRTADTRNDDLAARWFLTERAVRNAAEQGVLDVARLQEVDRACCRAAEGELEVVEAALRLCAWGTARAVRGKVVNMAVLCGAVARRMAETAHVQPALCAFKFYFSEDKN